MLQAYLLYEASVPFQDPAFEKVGDTTKVHAIKVEVYPADKTKPIKVKAEVIACFKPGKLCV